VPAVGAVVAIVAGVVGLTAPSSAAPSTPLTVTATARPASGSTVDPGTTITYTLTARSPQPFATGATVVDDLSGLLSNASITSSAGELARSGLAPDATHKALTWTLPALGSPGAPTSATATFEAQVAPSAPGGAKPSTAAALQGTSCVVGDPCATARPATGAST